MDDIEERAKVIYEYKISVQPIENVRILFSDMGRREYGMKKTIIAITIILFAAGTSIAGGYVAAKYAGEFMATGTDARALGMGGAYVAVANGVSAAYWNPAGLAHLNYPQIMGMYAERFAKLVNYNYGGIAIPSGEKNTLAFSFIRLGVDDIPVTALPNTDLELGAIYQDGDRTVINSPYVARTISDAEWAFYLSYAKYISHKLMWGSNAKIVTKHVGDNSAWGIGFDFGLLYQLYPRLNIGLNLQDITTTLLAYDTGRREAITPTVKLGATYLWDLPSIKSRVTPAMDFDVRFENRRLASQFNMGRVSFDMHTGLEFEFRRIVAVRIGSDVGHFAAGAGFRLPSLNIDYAFLSHDELGDTHRISLLLTLKEEKFSRK